MSKTTSPPLTSLLTASQVAQRLNVSRSHAYNLMNAGEIPTVYIGGARRVRPEDLEWFIRSNLRVDVDDVFFESWREV